MHRCLGRGARTRGALLGLFGMALLAVAVFAPAAQAHSAAFQLLAPSPAKLTAVAADPGSGLVYAQQNEGNKFFVYDPRTNAWTELASAPLNSGNNGGATFMSGKIYVAFTGNSENIEVYDIALNSWNTLPNPIGEGTGDITSANGNLYMAHERRFIEYSVAANTTTALAAPPKFAPPEEEEGFEPWGGLQVDGGLIYGTQGNGHKGFGVYNLGANSWAELAPVPTTEVGTEVLGGAVLGSAIDPITQTYLAYGSYNERNLYRYDIESGTWTVGTLPFAEVEDGGMAYVPVAGIEGVYMVEGEGGEEFARYTEANVTDLSASISGTVVPTTTGGEVTYSIQARNNGPERASGVTLSDALPSGSSLLSVATSQGSCGGTTAVSCAFGVLKSGGSATVTLKVAAPAGTVSSTATVASQAIDTNHANDSATSTLTVTPLMCKVPKLKGKQLKGAKKALLKAHCAPGKVKKVFNGKVKKGRVVKGGKPGKSLKAGTKIKLVVSKGAKP